MENKALEDKNNRLEKESLSNQVYDLISSSEKYGDICFINDNLNINPKFKKTSHLFLRVKKNIVAFIGVISEEKINVGLFISDNLITEDFNAQKIIKIISDKISGSGGGQPHFAVAGGSNTSGFNAATNQIKELSKNRQKNHL